MILHISIVERYAFLEDQPHFLENNSPGKQKHQYFAINGITEKKITGPCCNLSDFLLCAVTLSNDLRFSTIDI